MIQTGDKPRRRRFWKILLVTACFLLVVFGGLAWYAATDSFQAMVRRRLVGEVEKVTGGRVELGSFHAVPFRFRVEVRDLTIHGQEAPGEVPYAHVDSLTATVKIISVLGAEFGFSSVELVHPIVHLMVSRDGSTNQPSPKKATSNQKTIQDLFSLDIGHLAVHQGEILFNDRRIPIEFDADDVRASMDYSYLHRRYSGTVHLGKVDTVVKNFRPITWTADADFLLAPGSVTVSSLKIASGRSSLTAAGRIDDLGNPKFVGTYQAKLDLQEAAAVARYGSMLKGTLDANGQGQWSGEEFALNGKMSGKGVSVQDQSIAVSNANGTARFSIDPGRLSIQDIELRALGGNITGAGDVINWRNENAVLAKATQPSGRVTLKFKNVSVRDLKAVLVKTYRPLSDVKLAGTVNGTTDVRWRGSLRKAQLTYTFDVIPPSNPATGELPVTAHADGSYDGVKDEINLNQFDASTRTTKMRASGTLSSRTSMKLSVSTSNLAEWQPVVNALRHSSSLPVALHGQATFNGIATGKVSDISFSGNLQAQDFDTVIAATQHSPERSVHWDSLIADILVSQHALSARNAMLRHGATTVGGDFTANLQQGTFTEQSPFSLRLLVRNADATELIGLAGYDYPVTGTVNLSLNAGGTRGAPSGEGRLQLTRATLYGQSVQHLSSDLRVLNGDVIFNNLDLAHFESRVTGGATYNLSSGAFTFKFKGKDFDLARVEQLQKTRVKIDGRLDFAADGAGTFEEPVISAHLTVHDLAFDNERAGDFEVQASTRGADLRLIGRSHFEDAELTVDGTIRMRQEWPAEINLHFTHLDVDSLLTSYTQGRVTGHSAVAGDLDLRGPLRLPRQIAVDGNLSDFYADVENIKLRNDGPIRFSINEDTFKLDRFHLVGEETDIAGSGLVHLSGDRRLELVAQGRVNLRIIQTFNGDFTSHGIVTLDLTVGGTLDSPQAHGQLQIKNGSIAYIDLPSALSNVNGTLLFNQNRLEIQEFTGHTGGGVLTATGFATVYNRQFTFDLNLHGQDVRLRYPPGVSSTATADVRWAGTSSASTLSGDVTVTKLAITPGFDFGAYLAKASQTSALPQTNPLLNRIKLDVHILTVPELQMQTAVVRLSGDADLRLRGTAAKPVLLGRADVLEGEIYFNGSKYRMERGDVTFVNPVTTTPVLDLQASTHVRDYDVTVSLNGPPDRLHVAYRSEPPLPESDIIALLALGQTQEESAHLQQASQSAFNQAASSAILAQALNATVSNRVQRLFGGSRIKIDPQGLSTETSPVRGPQVTIEQQVANNLTVTYSTNVSQASQQIIQVEYNVTRNVSVVAVRDQNGVVSFDVRVRRRKK